MPPVTPALEPLRRIAAYAVATDADGRVLLVRASARSGTPGAWSLPGGAVDHGEDPNHTVVRETAAETGLSVAVTGLRDVLADMRSLPHRGVTIHTDRLIYAVTDPRRHARRPGRPPHRPGPLAHPRAEAAELRLRPFTAAALDLDAASADLRPEEAPDFPSFYAYPGPDGLHRAQRFAAYAIATDPADQLLLTRIAPGYPGARLLAPARRRHRLRRAARHRAPPRTGRGDRPGRPAGRAARRGQPPRRRLARPGGLPDRLARRARLLPGDRRRSRPRCVVYDVGGSTSEARWVDADATWPPCPPDELTEVTAEALRAARLI